VNDLGQNDLARLVRVSQTKICRLLAAALERSIVRIQVEEYHSRNDQLDHQHCSRFRLKSAAVIKNARSAGGEAARQTVGHFDGPFVASIIPASGIVAVGGGRSVSEVVQRFRRGGTRRLTVVQASGSIDSNLSQVLALELDRAIIKLWGGEFLTLSTPAFVADKKTATSSSPPIRSNLSGSASSRPTPPSWAWRHS
jgi:DNA-binding transcriptional regulator LsrR (DeoR family)